MPWFIKTEQFNDETVKLSHESRKEFLDEHRSWVIELNNKGIKASSGYLVDKNHLPGGGGLLILKACSFAEAKSIIEQDPMIVAGLVTWVLQEWVPVFGQPMI